MKNQTYRMTMLFDFYGELLTERQKEFFDLYYNEDLSLSEIAENEGISRQGVRDVIVRAEAAMQEIEDKTGLIRRFEQFRGHLDAIGEAANEIKTLNYRQYEDNRLTELTDQILAEAAMQEVEDKTGLIRRFEQFRGHLDAICDAAEEIRTLNYRQYEDSRLTELTDKITAEASALKE